MELFEHRRKRNQRFPKNGILLLKCSRREAIKLIESLTQQMLTNSANVGRWENFLKDGRDFSISVEPEESSI